MKTRYLTKLATLVFLGFSVPAAAHDCSRHNDQNHKHCAGDEGPQTTYTVEVQAGNVSGVVATGACAGVTTSSKRSVSFPAGCGQVMLDGMNYDLFGLEVKFTNKGTSTMHFFRTTCCAPNNSAYNTGYLEGLMEPADDVGAAFQITVNETEVFLKKIHQPNRGTTLTDPISVGKIVYTADP